MTQAPIADRRPTSQTHHGITRHDDYAWLRAENWQEAMRDPARLPEDIASYLNAENAYYEAMMASTTAQQDQLVTEMRGRIKEDDSEVPVAHGPWLYSVRFETGAEHPIYERTPRDGGQTEILIDVNKLAAAHDYFVLGGVSASPDHRHAAWDADTNGSEFFALHIRDLASGRDLDMVIADVAGFAWADPETLFYVKVDENHRATRLYRHRLHSDPANDVLVYHEQDPRYDVGVGRSRSGEFIFVYTGMNDENEVLTIPTATPEAAPQVVAARTPGLEYNVEHQGDRFVILTNADGAQDFKIVTAPVSTPGRDNWSDLLPARAGRRIVDIAAFADWLVWLERENALPRINLLPLGGNPDTETRTIAFDEEAFALGLQPSPEYATDSLRFVYTSPTTPAQTYDYHLADGSRTLLKETTIPSGHDPADYVTRRLQAVSHDGAEVPLTLLYHRNTALDGTAPAYMTGYGAYGVSRPAAFDGRILSLVDRGFVAVTAHVRGGEEKGRGWYEDAKFGRKVNTFHDFIAAGEHLIAQGFCAPDRLVIQGGSAGGLLMGAVANMRPGLWAGVIADVPFVDVLNTILDDTLPLTPGEWSQWGNPIESAEAFADIHGYSPYDNVAAQDYPPMLVTAGVSDPRVTYWEPAKWVARLRTLKTDDNPLMLRTNMTSGHFGKSGRFAALEDAARSYAFALMVTAQRKG